MLIASQHLVNGHQPPALPAARKPNQHKLYNNLKIVGKHVLLIIRDPVSHVLSRGVSGLHVMSVLGSKREHLPLQANHKMVGQHVLHQKKDHALPTAFLLGEIHECIDLLFSFIFSLFQSFSHLYIFFLSLFPLLPGAHGHHVIKCQGQEQEPLQLQVNQ